MGRAAVTESLEVLAERGWLKLRRAMGREIRIIEVPPSTFTRFGRAYVDDYTKLEARIASAVANEVCYDNTSLVQLTGGDPVIVDHILREMQSYGEVTIVAARGGHIRVQAVSASLKRRVAGR